MQLLLTLLNVSACLLLALAAFGKESQEWLTFDARAKTAFAEGKLDQAQSLWEEALKRAESEGEIEPGVVTCLKNLALVFDKKGNYSESERLYELAMRNMEGLAGPNSPRFADWMPDLAWLYDSHGRPEQSEILFKRALSIKKSHYGQDSKEVADLLDVYARFLKRNNRNTEASELFDRARQIRSKAASGTD